MQITSLEQLQAVKQSEIIELPRFEDGTPFVVEIKKPNMMDLLVSGKIPNALLSVATDMFNGKAGQVMSKATNDLKALKELVGMMEVLAEASLVQPSYKDIKKANIKLTENQLMAILTYSQGGVKALENFRNQQADN